MADPIESPEAEANPVTPIPRAMIDVAAANVAAVVDEALEPRHLYGATDPYRTAAAIEPDEPPGAFAARVVSFIVPRVNLLGLIDTIAARDAAVRREALREAARIVGRFVPNEPTHRTDVSNALAEYEREILALAESEEPNE